MIIHALLGILIASHTSSKILILILGIVSHFILDMIPHWDGPFNREEFKRTGKAKINKLNAFLRIIDAILVISLVYYIAGTPEDGLLIFSIFSALLPDIIKIGYITKLKNNKHYMNQLKFHAKIQKDADWRLGLIIQLIIALIIIYLIPSVIL